MNKHVKKLRLHRETLRTLSERDLQDLVGAGLTDGGRTCPGWTQAYATCDCSLPETFWCNRCG